MDFTTKRSLSPKTDTSLQTLFMSFGAYLFSEIFTYPLESLKVRLQMSGAPNSVKNYSSIRECLAVINQTRGIRGQFTGLGLSFTRESIFHVLKFYSYEEVKDYYLAGIGGSGYYRRALAIITASAIATLPLNCLDVSRIKMLNSPQTNPSGLKILTTFLQDKNNITKGYLSNFLRLSLYFGAELFGRDQTKLVLKNKKNLEVESDVVQLASVGIGALLGSIASIPIDTVRTRFFSQLAEGENQIFSSATRTFVYMIKKEGVFSVFRGFSLYLVRNFLMSTIGYVTYQSTKKIWNNNK